MARITGRDAVYKYVRCFVKPVRDYTYASKFGRGQEWYYQLAPGVYEIGYPHSWRCFERYFGWVTGGKVVTVKQEDVEEWLSRSVISE